MIAATLGVVFVGMLLWTTIRLGHDIRRGVLLFGEDPPLTRLTRRERPVAFWTIAALLFLLLAATAASIIVEYVLPVL